MQKEKLLLLSLVSGTIFMLIGVIAYLYALGQKGELDFYEIMAMSIPVMIAVGMAILIKRRVIDYKKGLPMDDERSKNIMHVAAARSFYMSLYWVFAISMFERPLADLFQVKKITASQVISLAIIGMAVFFFGNWFYLNRKGV